MSEKAEKAYAAAVKKIARVKKSGEARLFLGGEAFRALDRLPAELNDCSGLRSLDLRDTQIGDITLEQVSELSELELLYLNRTLVTDKGAAYISKLKKLKRLNLSDTRISEAALVYFSKLTALDGLDLSWTNVRDLRPIRDLPFPGPFPRLLFANTPAAKYDPMLEDLAVAESRSKATRQTLAYLKRLPQYPDPLPWLVDAIKEEEVEKTDSGTPNHPEQDPALPLIWGEKGFSFLASRVDADNVTEVALEDLRGLLDDLQRKGNRHEDLYRIAGEIKERSAGGVSDLSMVRLHLSYQKLRRIYDGRGGRSDPFDDETISVVGSVLEILPAVTLADAGVRTLIERQEADRLAQKPPETVEAERSVIKAITSDDAPFDEFVKDTAQAILIPDQNDRLAATRSTLARNSFLAVFRFLRHDPIGAGITGGVVLMFAQNYGPTFLALAQTIGADALLWAQMILAGVKSEAQIAVGIAREAASLGAMPKLNKDKDGR